MAKYNKGFQMSSSTTWKPPCYITKYLGHRNVLRFTTQQFIALSVLFVHTIVITLTLCCISRNITLWVNFSMSNRQFWCRYELYGFSDKIYIIVIRLLGSIICLFRGWIIMSYTTTPLVLLDVCTSLIMGDCIIFFGKSQSGNYQNGFGLISV